jgi:hypothetical protein
MRVIHDACSRSASLGATAEAARIRRLIDAGAWTDAALALVEFELPNWRVRRLVRDGGLWHCALSRWWDAPDWLDDAAEACHPDLSIAVLAALVEARCALAPASEPRAPADAPAPLSVAICCDNFG